MQPAFPHAVLQLTPALNAGGVERTTIEIAQALTEAGGRAIVASRGGRMERELARTGAELVRLPLDSKNPTVMLANIGRIRSLAQSRQVRLVHARSRAPAWSGLWAARQLGLPLVTTYHGIYKANSIWKRFYNSVMARGDVVIANSDYTRAHVLETYAVKPERVVTIHRGVDVARFDPEAISQERRDRIRQAWGLPGDDRLLAVLPARQSSWKGHALAIEALARLERLRPGALRLVFAGASDDGRFSAGLARTAAVQEVGGLVHFVGHVDDMPAGLSVAHVALFPSTRPEAFGRGAVEAQAMRLPVVAAGHGGLAETVQHGETGLLFPPGDAAALCAALLRLLDMTPAARLGMGERGRMRVVSLFTAERLKDATLEVYRTLLERSKA